jgi:hypothetical protein
MPAVPCAVLRDTVGQLAGHLVEDHMVGAADALRRAREAAWKQTPATDLHLTNPAPIDSSLDTDAPVKDRAHKEPQPMACKRCGKPGHNQATCAEKASSGAPGGAKGRPPKPVSLAKAEQERRAGKNQTEIAKAQGVHRNTLLRRRAASGGADVDLAGIIRAKRERLTALETEAAALRSELADVARLLKGQPA